MDGRLGEGAGGLTGGTARCRAFVGSTLAGVASRNGGGAIDVDASIDTTPSVLYDAVVVPDGSDAAGRMAADGRMLEFLKDQYRHCKPMLVLGSGTELLDKAGIPQRLPSDEHDPGLLLGSTADSALTGAFLDCAGAAPAVRPRDRSAARLARGGCTTTIDNRR